MRINTNQLQKIHSRTEVKRKKQSIIKLHLTGIEKKTRGINKMEGLERVKSLITLQNYENYKSNESDKDAES